jgi:hypothetical protein
MEGVPYPVLGVSDKGDTKMMYPGEDYKFKGKKVTEYPVGKNWLEKYAEGGDIPVDKSYDIQKASSFVFSMASDIDKEIQETEPFKLIKTDPEAGKAIIIALVQKLGYVAQHLEPLLPETSKKIINLIINHQIPETPLFVRKD